MKKTFLFLSLLVVGHAYSQNYDPAYPHVSVMTPEAAALARYADIPVSHYTGVPNISIPLYTINVDGFELPITLNYHSSGIRVDQEATWVGLGWSLDVGGRISRTAKGIDDFLEYGQDPSYPYYTTGYYDAPDISNYMNFYEYEMYDNGTGIPALRINKVIDTEPDIFYYSIPGYNGKFLIDKTRGAVLFDKSHNLKVEVQKISNPQVVVFKITDPDGNQYFFQTKEHSSYYSANSSLYMNMANSNTQYDDDTDDFTIWVPTIRNEDGELEYEPTSCVPYRMPSSWCLTQIVTRTGRIIDFNYTSYTEYLPTQESTEVYNNNHTSNQFFYKSKVVNEGWQLSCITWDYGMVTFNTSSREDIKGTTKKLDRVVIKNNNNETLRQYQFGYTYFNDGYNGNPQFTHVFKRLKLLSMTEQNTGEEHQFTYYEGVFPAKNTKNVDYWGMQNGRNYGSKYQIGVFVGSDRKFKGVQKGADFDHAVIGMLRQIQYPTRGYARFTYELNRFNRYFSYITNNNTALDRSEADEEGISGVSSLIDRYLTVYNDYVIHAHTNLPSEHTDTITITGRTLITIDCHMENHQCDFRDPDYFYHNSSQQPLARLRRLTPSAYTYITYECPYIFEGSTGDLIVGEGCEVDLTPRSFWLEAGTYEFKAFCPPKDVDAQWHLNLDRQTIRSSNTEQGGGLRIRSIETNNSTRYFNYPTGLILVEPTLYYYGNRIGDGSSNEQCVVQVSESRIPLSSFNHGNFVGYDWVEEELESDEVVSRVKHYFMNEQEEKYDDNSQLPCSPVYINYFNGIENKTEFTEDDYLVKEVDYNYGSTYSNTIFAMVDFGNHYNTSQMITYSYQIEWPKLSRRTETLTYDDGETSISDIYDYSYNSHDLPSDISHIVDGSTHTQHFLYPFDLNDNISLSMVRNNIIKQPVETFNTIGSLVFSGNKTAYRDSTQLFMPDKIYNLETVNGLSESNRASGYVLNVEYEMYDAHGNILQISERGKKTAYVWGYNHQYPVAEVKGATYEQVVAALGGASVVDNFAATASPTDTQVRQFLQPLLTGVISSYSLTNIYTYRPLVGITSQTAPNGMLLYYEYDSAGRLVRIKDTNEHTVKQYQYHYKP